MGTVLTVTRVYKGYVNICSSYIAIIDKRSVTIPAAVYATANLQWNITQNILLNDLRYNSDFNREIVGFET